ncbi:ribonuclease H-like protein [Patellaria atrata CBS 101060]|uniref:Ribonuclease H-like protein n=1 Tax=Patellaria atrata CBS 101060 TaxID=1346257 RepID=A0A9P4SDF2_9PEZI|nr:ribonuclease H-like protein [Patellaria atrata CBS 101060]
MRPPPSSLSSLKLLQLRHLLSSIGAQTSGTKTVLLTRLRKELLVPRLALPLTGGGRGEKGKGEKGENTKVEKEGGRDEVGKTRILSIDMGIRNLAFCVVDVRFGVQGSRSGEKSVETDVEKSTEDAMPNITVIAWRKVSLVLPTSSRPTSDPNSPNPDETETPQQYHPLPLSRTAYALLKQTLLPYFPTTILIERQRFRSGGGAAIQEWTVRVNMLEAMVYAVLETLRAERGVNIDGEEEVTFPAVWDVNPKRVGRFWLGSEPVEGGHKLTPPSTTGMGKGKGEKNKPTTNNDDKEERKRQKREPIKIQKKDKIALVARWIHTSTSTSTSPSGFDLAFAPDADVTTTKSAFEPRPKVKVKGKASKSLKKSTDTTTAMDADTAPPDPNFGQAAVPHGKLDDLADCLLQAAAWVAWERNRRRILRGGC